MKLIIDCDPGNGVAGADVDDALALALALRSPEIDLLAVTVVCGNVPTANATVYVIDQVLTPAA